MAIKEKITLKEKMNEINPAHYQYFRSIGYTHKDAIEAAWQARPSYTKYNDGCIHVVIHHQ